MLIFEACYNHQDLWIEIPSENFHHIPGSSRQAFFAYIEHEGEALEAKVRIKDTNMVLEHREYGDD